MIKFRKGKLYIFKLNFMQLFSADTKIFKEFFKKNLQTPKHKKICSQKLLIIPLDQQLSVQQVFAL